MQDGAQKLTAAAAGQQAESSALNEQMDTRQGVRAATVPGLEFPRFFTVAGQDPFDQVEWELRDALIGNEKGSLVFEQRGVEMPKAWSQQATNIVVSKYFRGHIGSPDR